MSHKQAIISKKTLIILLCSIGALLAIACIVGCILILPPFSCQKEDVRVNIDTDDNADSVYLKLALAASPRQLLGFKLLATTSGYTDNIHTGSYVISPKLSSLGVLRKLRNHRQDPVNLLIPSVRTKENLAQNLERKLMLKGSEILALLDDSAFCAAYSLDTANIIGIFIPNTYQVYWDISAEQLVERMSRESKAFWTDERLKKAELAGLTPQEAITLASIIDEETANNAEKPMIAGMYLNRLRIEMPLQADPTVKFALRDFSLRRIYHKHLSVDSPYNTYMHTGLPPGPIRIPSIAGIDAVLNYVHHDYLYMCAKEDFSGTHNFAASYREHMQNARRYARALNERQIH